jgi:uncharacterized membrane protein
MIVYASRRTVEPELAYAACRAAQKLYKADNTAPNLLLLCLVIVVVTGEFCSGRISALPMEPDLR